jgi:hypothetical protein
MAVALAGVVAAITLVYITKYVKVPAWETFTGMIAGVLLWASLVEIGVKMGAKALGIEEGDGIFSGNHHSSLYLSAL